MRILTWVALAFFLSGCRFYEVDPSRFYRSPQPSAETIDHLAASGIKTIINLRGAHSGESWYDRELEATTRNGLKQIDIGMSAERLPHRKDLIRLLDAFKNSPRPILLHCQAGVDRTGEASAIYEMLYMGKSKKEALEMLSLKFGYLESNEPAKIYFIRDVWQGETWAREQYFPCSGQYHFYDIKSSECKEETARIPALGNPGRSYEIQD